MDTRSHPVWDVYDALRTACLNRKYYERRLCTVERWTLAFDIVLAVAAPTSAIAGLWLVGTPIGAAAWKVFGVIAAVVAVLKPPLGLPKRIKEFEGVVAGYRMLEYELAEIRTLIAQDQTYTEAHRALFLRTHRAEAVLVAKNPESRENADVKSVCEREVLRMFPDSDFFVPKDKSP